MIGEEVAGSMVAAVGRRRRNRWAHGRRRSQRAMAEGGGRAVAVAVGEESAGRGKPRAVAVRRRGRIVCDDG
jgi:hypothetical protein